MNIFLILNIKGSSILKIMSIYILCYVLQKVLLKTTKICLSLQKDLVIDDILEVLDKET